MEKRDQSVRVWTTPTEHRLFSQLAKQSGASLGSIVRTCLLVEIDRVGMKPEPTAEVSA